MGDVKMPLSAQIKSLILSAWDDGYPCLLATNGREGPNITPKGSMIVFDEYISPIGSAPSGRCWRTLATTSASA